MSRFHKRINGVEVIASNYSVHRKAPGLHLINPTLDELHEKIKKAELEQFPCVFIHGFINADILNLYADADNITEDNVIPFNLMIKGTKKHLRLIQTND